MKNEKYIMIAVSLLLSMIFIDETGVGVMLPYIQHQFHTSQLEVQWIMNGFFLPLAVLVLFGGKLSDHFGHKKIYLIGMIVFILSSLICGLAPNSAILIIGRLTQGVGVSLLLSTYAVLLNIVFGDQKMGIALGTCAAFGSVFLATGPMIGGFFSSIISWRIVFLINVPLSILSILFVNKAIPFKLMSEKITKDKFDIVGSFLFIFGFSALIYALMESINYGLISPQVLILLLVSIVIIGVFCVHQLKTAIPFIDLRLFKERNFFAGNMILLCTQVVVMSLTYWGIWLQLVLGYSAFFSGIALLPAGLPILLMARVSGKWADRNGMKYPISLGSLLIAMGMVWMYSTAHFNNYYFFLVTFLAYGFGAPLIISPAIAVVLSSVSKQKIGMASGVFNTSRQLGATLCFATVGVVISQIYTDYGIHKLGSYTYAFQYGMLVTMLFSLLSVFFSICVLKKKV